MTNKGRAGVRARHAVGMNKGWHDVSACLISAGADKCQPLMELWLKDRVLGQKHTGGSIAEVACLLKEKISNRNSVFAESGTAYRPDEREKFLESKLGHLTEMKKRGLSLFFKRFNPNISFLTHHLAHAYAATLLSPFRRSIIVVMDGAGSSQNAFDADDPELKLAAGTHCRSQTPFDSCLEWFSVYLQDGKRLKCVDKQWETFRQHKASGGFLADGLGMFYETAARYVFNSSFESGKIMGLAPFGQSRKITDRVELYRRLDWKNAFSKRGKQTWERSSHRRAYSNLAASVQTCFEEQVFALFRQIRTSYPDRKNIIFTGGSALNCVFNSKLLRSGLFSGVYIPPFPGDESISVGAASYLWYKGQTLARLVQSLPKRRSKNASPAIACQNRAILFLKW